jgi:type II secretory pathway component PulM
MNWKFWLSASEPRSRYMLLMAVGVLVLMTITRPFWGPGGPGMAAFSAMLAVIVAHVSAKLLMKR